MSAETNQSNTASAKPVDAVTPSASPPAKPPKPTDSLNGPFPDEIKGWNWGAFWLSFFWGIAHRAWLVVAVFAIAYATQFIIPRSGPIGWLPTLVELAVAIYLGIVGNRWAWKHRRFKDINQFRAVQHRWAAIGLGLLVLFLIIFIGLAAITVYGAQRNALNLSSLSSTY